MNAVGIDVSKGKSMVMALRPREYSHSQVSLEQLPVLGQETYRGQALFALTLFVRAFSFAGFFARKNKLLKNGFQWFVDVRWFFGNRVNKVSPLFNNSDLFA